MTASTGRRAAASDAAWQTFRVLIEAQGGRVLEPRWLGSKKPHRVRCRQGHLSTPTPRKVMEGVRICTTCPGKKSAETERRFRVEVTSQGGRVIGDYAGVHERIACICAAGHTCTPMPSLVLGGGGVCSICSGRCQSTAGNAFRAGIAEQGGHMIGEYVNARTPVTCICAAGHECRSWPEVVKRGENMCRVCARQDPAASEVVFRQLVAELGGQVVGEYVNSLSPIDCLCPVGHPCSPTPGNVRRGQGMCNACAGKVWDVFYVSADRTAGRIKFGITSGDERVRLAAHRRAGYTEVIRLLANLPDAHALEKHVRRTLRDAGILAVQGREHFHAAALAVVLDVVDGWIAI